MKKRRKRYLWLERSPGSLQRAAMLLYHVMRMCEIRVAAIFMRMCEIRV